MNDRNWRVAVLLTSCSLLFYAGCGGSDEGDSSPKGDGDGDGERSGGSSGDGDSDPGGTNGDGDGDGDSGPGGSTGGRSGGSGGSGPAQPSGFVASCIIPGSACISYFGSYYTVETVENGCDPSFDNTYSTSPCDVPGAVGACVEEPFPDATRITYEYPYDDGGEKNLDLLRDICEPAGEWMTF